MRTITLALMSALVLAVAAGGAAGAQTASEHVALGDQAYAALNVAEAQRHYEAALAADSTHYDALCKASRGSVDLGEAERDRGRQMALFRTARSLAARAVSVNGADAEGHFHLARALGRAALSVGVRERVKYATDVREHALAALRANPNHPGALHVMGVWNAEVMRLNGVERFFAKNVLGGRVFGSASWGDAVSYMERAVAADPERLTHRLDLGKIYLDRGEKAKAREMLEFVVRGRAMDPNDPAYKREAESLLRRM